MDGHGFGFGYNHLWWQSQGPPAPPPVYDGLAANLTTDEDGAFIALM